MKRVEVSLGLIADALERIAFALEALYQRELNK